MPTTNIPFGDFLPSAPDFRNPGCIVADNVIPAANGSYRPLNALVDSSETVNGTVMGAQQFYNQNGASVIVGGTADTLFARTTAFVETTGLTSIGSGEFWDFAQFNNFIVATAVNNPPQYLTDINTDTTFSDLPGSPPQMRHCARVGDFLVLGNEENNPTRITWSAINSPTTTWETNRQNQSGNATLPVQFGPIQRIVGGRYSLIFQERGIIQLNYVGPPQVWRVDILSRDRGTIAPFSVVDVGYQTFFLSQDGFSVTNGSEAVPIGNSRINSWFFDNADQSALGEVHGAVDWDNGAVFWAFKSNTAANENYDRLLVYSWRFDRWATATLNTRWVVGTSIDGINLEQLDAIFGNLDAIPGSLDDTEFRAGARRLAAFTGTGATSSYETFNGNPMQAMWETGEFEPAPAQRAFVSEIYPLIEAEEWDIEAAVIARNNRNVEVFSNMVQAGYSGFCAARGEGQKIRIRMVKPGGSLWDAAQGVQVNFEVAGMR